MLKRIILTAIFLGPAAAWALYKPVRVLAPQLVKGISCVTNTICLEDTDRYAEAKNLYANALAFVDSQDPTSENRYRNTDPDLKSGSVTDKNRIWEVAGSL